DNNKSETLIYAVYNGQDTATDVFKTMRSNQSSTGERIEAYAVVSKDLKGKVRVRDQRKTDAGVGAAIGGIIGLVGGPIGGAGGSARPWARPPAEPPASSPATRSASRATTWRA